MKTKAIEPGKYVALMRGINVGGKNMLPMVDLAKMFVAAGCGEVRTYIQSGNVIFCAERELAEFVAEAIAKQIAKKFKIQVPVVVRSEKELEEIVANNPFIKPGAAGDNLHVMFLADLPERERVAGLDVKRSSPDEFIVRGREIFLKLPNGAGRSKLTNAYFDSKLKTVSTSRNWRTVLKLVEMMKI
jgi:uncharacterized protein (DUF1697 family)